MDTEAYAIEQLAPRLMLYRQILDDEVIIKLLEYLSAKDNNQAAVLGQLYFALASAAEQDEQFVRDGWKNHLLNLIAWDDNPFSRQAAQKGSDLSPALYKAAEHDLHCLHQLYRFTEPLWAELIQINEQSTAQEMGELMTKFEEPQLVAQDYTRLTDLLIQFYGTHGTGIFGRYHTLRWDGAAKQSRGVKNPDPIELSQLIGYERERRLVLDNTESFLAGYPANNVLLYGDRGTGKSSTVKALVNAYGSQGLRLLEVPKQSLADLPMILEQICRCPKYFILFVDDLSFEDFEVEYKVLKAILEGGVEARPQNVLIYATTNRRNLVRQSFSERNNDDVHAGDTLQEKLSLADRFGLTVTFIAPDKRQYLEIVEGLAKQRKLKIGDSDLHTQALQWELRHSGRSGRVAKQFVDYLEGELSRG